MALLISETFINETKGYQFGDTEPYEPYTDNLGRLFRDMQKEYGRCVGPVCVDTLSAGAVRIGWVFSKRMRYDDARSNRPEDHYIRETWVTVYEACEPDDPMASRTRAPNGAVTRHPFKVKHLGKV